MDRFIIWHRLRGHGIVNTGACDIFGTEMKFCVKCQCRWHVGPSGSIIYFQDDTEVVG